MTAIATSKVRVVGSATTNSERVLTADALAFLQRLHTEFADRRQELLHRRVEHWKAIQSRDAELTFQFLCKVTHELRRSLRHNVIIARRDAVGRVTMFLRVLEQNGLLEDSRIDIPMSRSDVANYLGLSLESVSRALGRLERSRIIAYEGRHGIRVVDRNRFDKILSAL